MTTVHRTALPARGRDNVLGPAVPWLRRGLEGAPVTPLAAAAAYWVFALAGWSLGYRQVLGTVLPDAWLASPGGGGGSAAGVGLTLAAALLGLAVLAAGVHRWRSSALAAGPDQVGHLWSRCFLRAAAGGMLVVAAPPLVLVGVAVAAGNDPFDVPEVLLSPVVVGVALALTVAAVLWWAVASTPFAVAGDLARRRHQPR